MMQVSLDPSLEEFVTQKVRSGQFASASDVVSDAVRRIKEIEEDQSPELESLRRELQVGIDQLDRGEGTPWNADEIKQEGRRLLEQRQRGA